MTIDFTRDKTQIIKGVAIITMIIHHCITSNLTGVALVDAFGASMKVCVSYFAFLVGFGYAFSKQQTATAGLRRALKLLVQFWLLLFVVFIPLHLYEGGNITTYMILTNMFGLESDLHHFSWFLYFYIYAMVLMPLISRVINKYGIKALVSCIVLSFGVEAAVHVIPAWSENIFLQALFDCQLYSPLLFLGYYLAKNKVYSKFEIKKSYVSLFVIGLLLLLVGLLWKRAIAGFLLDFFYIPLIIFCILGLFTVYEMKYIRKAFIKLGDMSMPMWFLHALFIMPFFTTSWLHQISDGNPWLIFMFVTPVSYILAVVFDKLSKPIINKLP